MKENPDEIKSKTHNETYIDLLILGIEKKEREREKSQPNLNDNFANLFGICCSCSKGLLDFNQYSIGPETKYEKRIKRRELLIKYIDYYRNKNESENVSNNKKSEILNSNIIVIDYELPKFKKSSMKLCYSIRIYYLLLFLNIFFPGVDTIIAAIGWGNTCKNKNRTKELLLRGILQILTSIFIIGWIQSIFDAINYFAIVNIKI